jgi:hypothetical protein
MTDWCDEVKSALTSFVAVAKLAGDPISEAEMEIEYLKAPHRPPTRLPAGKMAIYGFWGDGGWLKIGKAGPNSAARYTSQHYNLRSTPSTLAKSLASDPHMRTVKGFDQQDPGVWIKANTHRVNILLPSQRPREFLALMEAFLHLRLRPRYEG